MTNTNKAIIFAVVPSEVEQKKFINWRLQLAFLCAHCIEYDLDIIEKFVLSDQQDKDSIQDIITFVESQSEPVALVFLSLSVLKRRFKAHKELETLIHLKNTEVHFMTEQIIRHNNKI